MRNFIFIALATCFLFISGCTKDVFNPDAWVGTYNGTTSNGTLARVYITKVDATTISIQLQTNLLGTYYTYCTLASARSTGITTIAIDENTNILGGANNPYHCTGSGTLNGNTITFSGTAVSTTNSSDQAAYYFSGSK